MVIWASGNSCGVSKILSALVRVYVPLKKIANLCVVIDWLFNAIFDTKFNNKICPRHDVAEILLKLVLNTNQ